jgi:hypothetical protein
MLYRGVGWQAAFRHMIRVTHATLGHVQFDISGPEALSGPFSTHVTQRAKSKELTT